MIPHPVLFFGESKKMFGEKIIVKLNQKYKFNNNEIVSCKNIDNTLTDLHSKRTMIDIKYGDYIEPYMSMYLHLSNFDYNLSIVKNNQIIYSFCISEPESLIDVESIDGNILTMNQWDHEESMYMLNSEDEEYGNNYSSNTEPTMSFIYDYDYIIQFDIYPDDKMFGNWYYPIYIYKLMMYSMNHIEPYLDKSVYDENTLDILKSWKFNDYRLLLKDLFYKDTIIFSGNLWRHFKLHDNPNLADTLTIDMDLQLKLNAYFKTTLYDPVIVEYNSDFFIYDIPSFVILKDDHHTYILGYTNINEYRIFDLQRIGVL